MTSLLNFVAFSLCLQALQVQKAFGQECKFVLENGDEIVDDGFGFNLQTIQDIEKPGKVLLVAKTFNVANITGYTSTTQRFYMEPIHCGRYLILTLTDEFANYENHTMIGNMSITVTFACDTGTKEIKFIQPIEDTIEHNPGSALGDFIQLTRGVKRRRRASCSCSGTCSCSGSCICSGSAICSG